MLRPTYRRLEKCATNKKLRLFYALVRQYRQLAGLTFLTSLRQNFEIGDVEAYVKFQYDICSFAEYIRICHQWLSASVV
jgi:hypothetical protein